MLQVLTIYYNLKLISINNYQHRHLWGEKFENFKKDTTFFENIIIYSKN